MYRKTASIVARHKARERALQGETSLLEPMMGMGKEPGEFEPGDIDEEHGLVIVPDTGHAPLNVATDMTGEGTPPTQVIVAQDVEPVPMGLPPVSPRGPRRHRHKSKSPHHKPPAAHLDHLPPAALGDGGSSEARWHRVGRAAQAAAALAQGPAPQVHLPGNVQGIDLSRSPEEWAWLSSHYSAECAITCVDFSPEQVLLHNDLTNETLGDFLAEKRPAWSKVRWLSVDRLSWDVIQSLGLHYRLHPLAVEDVLHVPQRIKADFYEHFLYVSLTLITLARGAAAAQAEPIRPATAVRSAVAAASCYKPVTATPVKQHLSDMNAPPRTPSYAMHMATEASAASRQNLAGPLGLKPTPSAPAGLPPFGTGKVTSAPPTQQQVDQAPASSQRQPQQQQAQPQQQTAFAQPQQQQQQQPQQQAVSEHDEADGGPWRPPPSASGISLSDVGEEGDVLASLPPRRLWRTTSISRPFGPRVPKPRSGESSPGAGDGRHSSGALGAARQALERLPSLLPGRSDPSMTRIPSKLVPHVVPTEEKDQEPYNSQQGVPVHRQQVSIFVVDNNTIISIFEASGACVTRPLLQQLRDPHTLTRDAGDASYLLCLLLDSLADSTYPVVDAYSDMVEAYEARILGERPQAGFTRELHLVQQDLATLRRTVLPTLHLVAALRSHATVANWDGGRAGRSRGESPAPPTARAAGKQTRHNPALILQDKMEAAFGPQPLVSRLTKTYLGDVQDHLTTVLDALDSQIDTCRDLIDLAFNLIAHGTNQAMQALTVVSVLFLPLTFLAGIYGMNFDNLPELHWEYGYGFFYGMCGIIVVVFLATMFRMGLMKL